MNQAISNNAQPIFATKVPVRERMGCFPGFFGDRFIDTENTVYSFAENIVVGYRGEFWDFYRLSNGGFFIAPTKALLYELLVSFGNGYRGEMSARATGLVVCINSYDFLAESTRNIVFVTQSERLREYANIHPEKSKILAAVSAGKIAP